MSTTIRVETVGSGAVLIPYMQVNPETKWKDQIQEIESKIGPATLFLVQHGSLEFGEKIKHNSTDHVPLGKNLLNASLVCKECTTNASKACRLGHIPCLKYIEDHGQLPNHLRIYALHHVAAKHGHIEVLKYLPESSMYRSYITNNVVYASAEGGNLDCLKYCLQTCTTDLDFDYLHVTAIQHGHLNLVEYLDKLGLRYNPRFVSTAALNGHLNILKFLFNKGYTMCQTACRCAAKNGHLDCLVFLHEQNCPWTADTCYVAIESNHESCLRYALTNGCSTRAVCTNAATSNNLDYLKIAREYKCRWSVNVCAGFAAHGNLEALQYVMARGCKANPKAIHEAINGGHLECVKLLHEQHGIAFPVDACFMAVKQNHLECLKYIHEHGADLDVDKCLTELCTQIHKTFLCTESKQMLVYIASQVRGGGGGGDAVAGKKRKSE